MGYSIMGGWYTKETGAILTLTLDMGLLLQYNLPVIKFVNNTVIGSKYT